MILGNAATFWKSAIASACGIPIRPIPVSMTIALLGEPLSLTLVSMALNAVIASIVLAPLLMLMNDRAYLREYTNGPIGNVIGVLIILLAVVIGIAAIPLEVFGG